jgi:hypothetical protein
MRMKPNMSVEDMKPWLGPAWDQLDEGKKYRFLEEAYLIDERYADADLSPEREASMVAAVQYLLGELTPDDAGSALMQARLDLARAMAVSKQVAVMACREGASEADMARRTGIDRMTVRQVLGKR